MEYFDVVDEQDKPTGKLTTKVEAHRDGIWHRLVAIYVFDRDGKLLVQDHKKHRLLDHSVGGHVSAGEDYLTAAKREGEEELGLKDEELKEICTSLYSPELFDDEVQKDIQMHQFGIYECRIFDGWKFIPNAEVDKLIPMDLAEVVQLMNEQPGRFTPGFINTMAKYLKVTKSPFKYYHATAVKKWGKSYAQLSTE